MEDFIKILGKIEDPEICKQVKRLIEQYDELKSENVALKEENRRLADLAKSKEAKRVLGFTLVQKKVGKGFYYEKWYAFKRIEDQMYWVYLGKEVKGAEEKIKAFCKERGIVLSNKDKRKKGKKEVKEVGKPIALGQIILGFKVIEKTAKGIKQYQGYKRNGGKQCYVYLCTSAKPVTLAEAEKKIRQYCEKHEVGL